MAAKKFTIKFDSDMIMNVSVYKSKGGYNYVDIGIKISREQYMRINHEWEGDMTPDFVMDLLSTFGKEEASTELKQEFEDFVKRVNESTETI